MVYICYNIQVTTLSKQTFKTFLINKQFQLWSIYALTFFVPFIFKQPQLLIGSVVNLLLIFTISKFGIKKTLPLIFLPSLASLLNGTLFSTFTPYLLYMIPFIAIANLIFILSFKYIKIRYLRIVIPALLKASFLFSCAYILVNTIHIPQIFLTTMGEIQFFTAIIGGILVEVLIGINKTTKSVV